jgi:hypothetical protein
MADQHIPMNSAAGLDTSAAMVRAESGHMDATLRALVQRLSSVPGLNVAVTYRQGRVRRLIGDLPYLNDLHRASDPIQGIVVKAGPDAYWLRCAPGSITCGRDVASIERGHTSEELSFSAWATALFDEIAEQNFVNHESLVALRHLVEQDRV